MKKKILIAEDNDNFGMMLSSYLKMNHFDIVWAKNGQEALKELHAAAFDLCIFDVMMPVMDGFELASEARKRGFSQPFLFLTAKGMREDKITGFSSGAIDYLVKPFDPEILILKIKAIFEQLGPAAAINKVISFGSFRFDTLKRTLALGTAEKKLSPKECDLLQLLLANRETVLTREEALLKIWKDDGYFPTQSMNVFITKLRSHLQIDPHYDITIESIRGTGFLLSVKNRQ
ncbi:MAG TPA: response regulator transcription factor [Flavobacterium sp.]|nr:response regulator transcription factor [Flavobacterium sp.]